MDSAATAPSPSAGASSKVKRRAFLIKRTLQVKFIALVVLSVFTAIVMMGWDLYNTFGRDVVRDLMDPGLYDLFEKVGYVLLLKLVFYMAAVGGVALLVSHRLAGPIFHFERSSRIVAGGDLTHRVRLRRGDELVDLQEEFNAMLDSLRDRVSKDAALARRIAKHLDDLAETNNLSPVALQRVREIKAEIDHLTSGFKI